jgi:hypothetical protein
MKKLILIPMVIYMAVTFHNNCTFKNAVEEKEESKTIRIIINEYSN